MYCSKCGAQNDDSTSKCTACGAVLLKESSTGGSDAVSAIIPYKNVSALVAYYLGIFSIIPCFGALLGIPALILGIRGLMFVKEHPEAKGKAHAWIGIIVGGLFGIGNLFILIKYIIPVIMPSI